MKHELNIGVIIADENEFTPAAFFAEKYQGEAGVLFRKKGYRMSLTRDGLKINVVMILSGIGKVNAAASAALMTVLDLDYMISAGLSGGISRVVRGGITIGSTYVEHDFDLTPLGYEKGVKPGQDYIYTADEKLSRLFTSAFPEITVGGIVSGDCFVSDNLLRSELAEKYDAVSCDMESAAVASVCHDFEIGFIAVRRVSDDAGESADADYQAAKGMMEKPLLEIVFAGIEKMLDTAEFWN